jgi:hypothetical protein
MYRCRNVPSQSTAVQFSIKQAAMTNNTENKVRVAERPKISMFYKDESCETAWFTLRHIRKSKELRFKEGREWQLKGYGILLDGCYQNPIQEHLKAFVQLPGEDYLRGAESVLNEDLAKERHAMKSRALQAVVDHEIALKLEGGHSKEQIAAKHCRVSGNILGAP